jgi:hypothetical protein
MRLLLGLAGAIAALWLLDRLLVWCELRGWITYRLTPRPTRSLRRRAGDLLLGMDVFVNPRARHVVELRQAESLQREEDDEAGR